MIQNWIIWYCIIKINVAFILLNNDTIKYNTMAQKYNTMAHQIIIQNHDTISYDKIPYHIIQYNL